MGKVKVTPVNPSPLQGYDPELYVADPNGDRLDDLYARIVMLHDGQSRVVMVSFDCCLANEEPSRVADPGGRPGHYRDFVNTFPPGTRKRWGEAAGVPWDSVSVHATHTHTAPASFSDEEVARVADEIERLASQLQPVTLRISKGVSKISAFRRPKLLADYSVPVDQTLQVVSLVQEDGVSLGCLVSFAVHPTSVRNPVSRISSDLVGLAMNAVEKEKGGHYVALFLQGFSGDICPAYGDSSSAEDTYPDVLKGARHFGRDILGTLNRSEAVVTGPLRSIQKHVTVPTIPGFHVSSQHVAISGISVGELAILSIAGEVFNGYTDLVRARSPFKHLLLCGVANGYAGYLPTWRAYHDGLGGYEMNTTPYTDAVEDIVLDGVQEVLQVLYK